MLLIYMIELGYNFLKKDLVTHDWRILKIF